MGEALARRGDGRREARHQRDEAAHEADGAAVGLAQVDVLAAGPGHGGTELAVAERAAEGEHASHHPQAEDPAGVAEIGSLEAGGGEDPGSDDVRDHQQRRRAQADVARQRTPPRAFPISGLHDVPSSPRLAQLSRV